MSGPTDPTFANPVVSSKLRSILKPDSAEELSVQESTTVESVFEVTANPEGVLSDVSGPESSSHDTYNNAAERTNRLINSFFITILLFIDFFYLRVQTKH